MKSFNNTIYITFGLILFSGHFSSCVKDNVGDTFYVEGRVLEFETETPVANAKVFLWSATGEFLGPVRKTIIDTVRTNEHGEFRINYAHTLDSKFLTSTADKYFKSGEFDMVNKNKQNIDIIIDPHAWLRVKIVHEGPIGEYDRISMQYQSCTPDFIHILEKETEIICMRAGNKSHNLEYLKTRTSQLGERIKISTFLPGHDTTEVVINY